ncbi:alpha-protein kinase vwkA-like [Xenia sp. Carnegie-2017]|uniref:alpha-protein kinase vwkA-like n=1 Tax=Xenia sp. Carnegie-2017 TaxID=2897299 RepID=UPI001F045A1A|nr:alpha-protein kinase vwkA-like [Xenia sp. Carnegie-2017]
MHNGNACHRTLMVSRKKNEGAVNECQKLFPKSKFSFSFVGYGNHRDGEDRIAVLDFTESISSLEHSSQNCLETYPRIMFHMADRPCHGNRFHNPNVGDKYPDGDPRGLKIEDLLLKLREMNILYCFNEYFYVVLGKGHPSLSIQLETRYKIDEKTPNWMEIFAQKVIVSKAKIPDNLNKLKPKYVVYEESERRIKIAPNPFAEGTLRIAFYCQLRTDKGVCSLVLKQFKHLSKRQKVSCVEEMETQRVAITLARKFNDIKPKGVRDVVHFADVSVVTVNDDEN